MNKMCKLVKKGMPEKDPEAYGKLIRKADCFCEKCGLPANDSKRLCKAVKIKKKKKKDPDQ